MNNSAELVINQILIMLALILFGGVVFSKISELLHLPDVVLYIIFGLLIGPNVLNLIDVNQFSIGNELILTIGAAYILYDGGREVNLKVLNKVKISVLMLATVGVIISTFITGFFTMKIFGMSFMTALLAGAIVASTDPSVLIPLFKKIKIKDKLKQTIICESAFNDAVGAILTFTIITIILKNQFSALDILIQLGKSTGVGLIVGLIFGLISTLLVSEKPYGVLMEYPYMVSLATVCASYAVSTIFSGSGFMSVFIAGIIFGNKEIIGISHSEKHEIRHFHFKEVMTTIFRMMIFILLGTQIEFNIIIKYWLPALLVVLVLIFIARPISVLLCVTVDRKAKWNIREIIYLMWTRETGVIPAALSSMLVSMNIPNANIISSITFMTIIITLTIQASTAKNLSKALKLDII